MIELKHYQRKAIDDLKRKLIDMLNRDEDRQRLVFKAPTGSGKTVMASALLDELTRELPECGECVHTRVAWVWIAPNKLHEQSYRSMRNYFSETRSLRPVMFDDCDHLEGLAVGDVLFLNWESINKDNALLIRDNEQNRTLLELLRATRIKQGVPMVVVIDEEHMFGGRNATKSEKLLRSINPKIELRISATPVSSTYNAVVVNRSDVVAEEMIKKGVQLNPGLRTDREQQELTVNQRLLVRALKKRAELAEAYAAYGINPLLLIQLPNDTSDSLTATDRSVAEEMQAYLNAACDISVDNGRLAVWLSKDKSPNLDTITKPDDLCQVLLFKQAIALGWDCPRAAVLLIFREIRSVTFTTQTVGRILRMPSQRFYQDDRLNYGYVYTNLSADIIQVVGDDMNYLSTIYANRRPGITDIELRSVYQDKNGKQRNRLGAEFRRVFFQTMVEMWEPAGHASLFDEEAFFKEDDDAIEAPPTHDAGTIAAHRDNARRHGVQTDVTRIFVTIPKDTPLTGDSGIVQVTDTARLALNASELNTLFTLFCRKNVGPFSKFDSTPVLRNAIESALEEYLDIFSTDVPKVVLYHRNRPVFEHLILTALTRYTNLLRRNRPTEAESDYVEFTWQLPATRIYNSGNCDNRDTEIFNHALVPFFESRGVSAPEKNFARWLDRQTEVVDWWYKNGDEGKQNFAVPYTDIYGKRRSFYVDFIIRLKSGTICLFDTKTLGSDENGALKNNALYRYAADYRSRGKAVAGGVIVPMGDNWYFPAGIVDDINDTAGWQRLDLNNL